MKIINLCESFHGTIFHRFNLSDTNYKILPVTVNISINLTTRQQITSAQDILGFEHMHAWTDQTRLTGFISISAQFCRVNKKNVLNNKILAHF